MKTAQQRFEEKLERVTESGCWLWTGATGLGGYGQFWHQGRVMNAHRAAHVMFIGPVNDNQEVCHRCDVRCCVNPAHLFAGSKFDNMADAAEKGRLAHRTAKLSYEDALAIRASSKRGCDLADEYGVSRNIISRIRKGHHYTKPHALSKAPIHG